MAQILIWLRFLYRNVISTWSSGTGGAGIIGSASYIVLEKWLGAAHALHVMLAVPIIQAITFWIVLTHDEPTLTLVGENGIGRKQQIIEGPEMTFCERFKLVPSLLKYMIPLALVYLFEYFINQGLVSLNNDGQIFFF